MNMEIYDTIMDDSKMQEYVCSISSIEFEEYCLKVLNGYEEEEKLNNFTITHNVKIPCFDGTYQIDIYAEFTAMSVTFKVLCECKQYSKPVGRDKVAELHSKLESIGAHKGILLSTCGFQSGAVEYAKVHGIALIQVYDYRCEHLSHSSSPNEESNNDPFLYAEKHMPPYVAIDWISDSDESRKVYPTRAMVKKLLIEEKNMIKKVLGIDLDIKFPEI